MSSVEAAELLQEISPESPCGENLEYDAAFGELERALQAKPEQQFGDKVIPGEEPDWVDVKRQALALLRRTKDLRVAVTLARAAVRVEGLAAFSDALAVIRGYAERYWDGFHPRLDPDDDNDPTLRVNILCSLCDATSTLLPLKRAPLVSSPRAGRFGLYHVAIAKGDIPPPADMESPVDKALIEGAFFEADPTQLRATHDALVAAVDHVRALEEQFTDHVGISRAGSLTPLADVLRDAERVLAEQLSRRGLSDSDSPAAGEPTAAEAEQGEISAEEGAAKTAATVMVVEGEIRSRQDVVRMLEKICEYYERSEPSSPVPLLLRRAKRLASMSFLEVLRELAPDGVTQAESIGGVGRE